MGVSEQNLISKKALPNIPPIRESNFHTALQNAVVNHSNADFGLILSMVSQDAMELDQFHTPATKPMQNINDLEKRLFINRQALVGQFDTAIEQHCNQLVNSKNKQSCQLQQLLTNNPLIPEANGMADVIANMDLNQQRANSNLLNTVTDTKETNLKEQPSFDSEQWFDSLQQARTYLNVA